MASVEQAAPPKTDGLLLNPRTYDPVALDPASRRVLLATIEWFEARFEGPEHSVPFDSREGGYQYGNDGPYEAEDVLREACHFVTNRIIWPLILI